MVVFNNIIFNNCKKIIDMPMPKEVAAFVEGIENFKADEVQLYVKGICKKCKCSFTSK